MVGFKLRCVSLDQMLPLLLLICKGGRTVITKPTSQGQLEGQTRRCIRSSTMPGIQKALRKGQLILLLVYLITICTCKSPNTHPWIRAGEVIGFVLSSCLLTQEPLGQETMTAIQFVHSFNEYLLNTCCVTVIALNPRVQQWIENTKAKHQTNKISSSESLHSTGGR